MPMVQTGKIGSNQHLKPNTIPYNDWNSNNTDRHIKFKNILTCWINIRCKLLHIFTAFQIINYTLIMKTPETCTNKRKHFYSWWLSNPMTKCTGSSSSNTNKLYRKLKLNVCLKHFTKCVKWVFYFTPHDRKKIDCNKIKCLTEGLGNH